VRDLAQELVGRELARVHLVPALAERVEGDGRDGIGDEDAHAAGNAVARKKLLSLEATGSR
jgi:hypothetical protein